MQKLLTAKDVSKIFACSLSQTYVIMSQLDFPKMQLGHRYYVLEDELEKWLQSQNYKKRHLEKI